MTKIEGVIFDMDGTLWPFDRETSYSEGKEKFDARLFGNVIRFFQDHFGVDHEEAWMRFNEINRRYQGEVSIGLEKELGVPRSEYFAATWTMQPQEFMRKDPDLVLALNRITIKTGILSAAPQVWVNKVLNFLEIRQRFEPSIFNGEPDIRKPNPEAFLQVARSWQVPPETIISVGDLEKSDILPAKSVGMKTVRIGRGAPTQADWAAGTAAEAINLLLAKGVI